MRFTKEEALAIAVSIVGALVIAFIFFGHLWGIIPGGLAGIYIYKVMVENLRRKKRSELLGQFKAMLIAMQSALEAGNSMERSLKESAEEMRQLYGDKSRIFRELVIIDKKLRLNISQTGGNAIKIIKDTVNRIVEVIELGAELEVIVASKKLEQQLMVITPAVVILFLRVTSKGFLSPLYDTILGQIIMTVVLGINVFADYLGKRIVDINI